MKTIAKRPLEILRAMDGKIVKEGDIVYSRNLGKGKEPLTVFIVDKGYRGQFWAIKDKNGTHTGCYSEKYDDEYGISFEPLEALTKISTDSTSYTGPWLTVYNV